MPFTLSDYPQIPVIYYSVISIQARKAFIRTLTKEELVFLFVTSTPPLAKFSSWLHYDINSNIGRPLGHQAGELFSYHDNLLNRIAFTLDTTKAISADATSLFNVGELYEIIANLISKILNSESMDGSLYLTEEQTASLKKSANTVMRTLLTMVSDEVCSKAVGFSNKRVLETMALHAEPDVLDGFLQRLDVTTLTALPNSNFYPLFQRQNVKLINWLFGSLSPFKLLDILDDLFRNNEDLLLTNEDKIKCAKIRKCIKNPKHEIEKRPQEFIDFASSYLKTVSADKIPDLSTWIPLLELAIKACSQNDTRTKDQLLVLLARTCLNLCKATQAANLTLDTNYIKAFEAIYSISQICLLDDSDKLFVGNALINSVNDSEKLNSLSNHHVLAISFADNIYTSLEDGLNCIKLVAEKASKQEPPPVKSEPVVQLFDTKTVPNEKGGLLKLKESLTDVKTNLCVPKSKVIDLAGQAKALLKSQICSSLDKADEKAKGFSFNDKIKQIDEKSIILKNIRWNRMGQQLQALHKIAKPKSIEESLLFTLANLKIKFERASETFRVTLLSDMRYLLKLHSTVVKSSFFSTPYETWLQATTKILNEMTGHLKDDQPILSFHSK